MITITKDTLCGLKEVLPGTVIEYGRFYCGSTIYIAKMAETKLGRFWQYLKNWFEVADNAGWPAGDIIATICPRPMNWREYNAGQKPLCDVYVFNPTYNQFIVDKLTPLGYNSFTLC